MSLELVTQSVFASREPWWRVFYDFSSLTKSIDTGLHNAMSPFWVTVTEMLIIGVLILLFYAVIGLFLVYAEQAWS